MPRKSTRVHAHYCNDCPVPADCRPQQSQITVLFLSFTGAVRSLVTSGGVPGSWFKYYQGGWTEPGRHGRSTLLNNITGTSVHFRQLDANTKGHFMVVGTGAFYSFRAWQPRGYQGRRAKKSGGGADQPPAGLGIVAELYR